MKLQEPLPACSLASFIEAFPGDVKCEAPLIASLDGQAFVCFDMLNTSSIWVLWLYVPPKNRGKGAMRRLLDYLVYTSEKSFCPIYLYPREFAFLAWNPDDWPATIESLEYQQESGAPNWQCLDKIYKSWGFVVAPEITNTPQAIELGRLMLVYRPKAKRPKPIPSIRDLQRLYRREVTLEQFQVRFSNSYMG